VSKAKLRSKSVSLRVAAKEYGDEQPMFLCQNMIELGEGNERGAVDVTAGLGGDAIILRWRDRTAVVRGLDLLRSWMETWAVDDAKRLP
jgi:hypothetical protein